MSLLPQAKDGRWRWQPRHNRIRLVWTCCDACHSEHRTLFTARVHYLLLKLRGETL